MKRIAFTLALFAGIAGVVYLSTIGCCSLLASRQRPSAEGRFSDRLGLSDEQKRRIAPLEADFLAKKQAACDSLCAKREKLAQWMKASGTDQGSMIQLVEEIGRDQTGLEKATLEHLTALRGYLEPAQAQRLNVLVARELEAACEMTACGQTAGCAVHEHGGKQKP